MTRPKFDYPRSKLQARVDHPSTLYATVPAKIVHAMKLQAGDSIEWIWTTEGYDSYCKVIKVSNTT